MKVKSWIQTHLYCLSLLYFIFYLVAFVLLEKLVTPKYIIDCAWDQKIPFNEWFIIPYVSWYVILVGALGYFMFYSKKDFQDLCFMMFTGMTICLVIYAILPNGLNIRQTVPRDNILCQIVKWLYAIDTPTNVCPSIHVSSTVAINQVIWHSKLFEHKRWWKGGSVVVTCLICVATLFVKQHSIIDMICGILLTGILSKMTYSLNWRKPMENGFLRILL